MPLQRITETINELISPEHNQVFKEDILEGKHFTAMISRIKSINMLRDLYFKRANIHKNNGRFKEAALDYYESAKLGHAQSVHLFSKFDATMIVNYFKIEQFPDDLSSDQAFLNFIQFSTGIGQTKDRTSALSNLVYAVGLNHPETQHLKINLEAITSYLRNSDNNQTTLVRIAQDRGNSMLGIANERKNYTVLSYANYRDSSHVGMGAGFRGLANMHFFGKSLPVDTLKGLHYYTLAVETGTMETLPSHAYAAIHQHCIDNPESMVAYFNHISNSRLITLGDFHKNISSIFRKATSSFCFWPSEELEPMLIDKSHELLALCEIVQIPNDPQAGIKHMEAIRNLDHCLPKNCSTLVNFHREHPNRNNIDNRLSQLIQNFEKIADKEMTIDHDASNSRAKLN